MDIRHSEGSIMFECGDGNVYILSTKTEEGKCVTDTFSGESICSDGKNTAIASCRDKCKSTTGSGDCSIRSKSEL